MLQKLSTGADYFNYSKNNEEETRNDYRTYLLLSQICS